MAYRINRKDEHVVLPDGPATIREVQRFMKSRGDSEFYELEPAEVIEVWLDQEDLPLITDTDKPDWSKYGWIRARMAISNDGKHDTITIGPLDSNIQNFPYPGEYIIVVEYFGKKFYTQKLSLFNHVDSNILPGLSKTYNPFKREPYKENLPTVTNNKIRNLKAEEGDIIFTGRFANTIRFGSNIKEVKDQEGEIKVNTGKENSPNIKIRSGQGTIPKVNNVPVVENINTDGSSVYLTTDEIVPLIHHQSKVKKLDPNQFDGKQIVLNSDRIVFNSKGTDVFTYSNRDINFVSNRRIVLEGHDKVFLGGAPEQGKSTGYPSSDNPRIQPVLMGDRTVEMLEKILDALISYANQTAPIMGSVIDFKIPIDNQMGPSMELAGILREYKNQLNDLKSEKVHVELK